jgi:hypothetical protein
MITFILLSFQIINGLGFKMIDPQAPAVSVKVN